jgi:TolB-like protein/DNA-binding winged helix-turn-helix (wHTH) protein
MPDPSDALDPTGGSAARRSARRSARGAAGARADRPPAAEVLRLGGAEIDLAEGRVRAADGTETELRPKSAALLRTLAAAPGRTWSKDALLDAVWGDVHVTEDSLVQCVGDIRRALGPDRDALKTLPGRGYRLEAAARPTARTRPAFARLALATGLAAIALAAATLAMRPPPAGPPRLAAEGPAVAVLPFENLAPDPRWERLARGVTQEVIADLAANAWLFVFADATTRPHAGAAPRAVQAALGADYVVTGSVQAEGVGARVAATLTETRTGRQLWARDWEGPADDLLALQAAAAEAVTGALAGRYSGVIADADRSRARRRPTDSLEAYEFYLLGVEHKHRFTRADFDMATTYLERATAIDPGFAKAWAVLVIVEGFRLGFATTDAEVAEIERRIRDYAARAVAADPDDPASLLEISRVHAMDGDLAAAERAIRRAVALAPNDADTLAVAAWSGPDRAALGRDPLTWAERAQALNPGGPDWYAVAKGWAALAAGEYEVAAEALRASPKDLLDGWVGLAAAEALRGDDAAARAAAAEVRRLLPDFDPAFYFDGWPWEPGFRARLYDGALRAGLGGRL